MRHSAGQEAANGGGNGGAHDYLAMFEAMIEVYLRRNPAPVAATVDVEVSVPKPVELS